MRKIAAIAALAFAFLTAAGANAAVFGQANSGHHFHMGWDRSFSDGH
jgi:hypothetical protein